MFFNTFTMPIENERGDIMNMICIDIGRNKTEVARIKEIQGRYEVARIFSQKTEQKIVTQIVLTNEQMHALKGNKTPSFSLLSKLGEISIGNYLPMSVENGEKFIYFKVSPKDFDKVCANTEIGKACGITHGMVMACYAYALTVNIFKYNVGDCDESDRAKTELLVGCPTTADWTSNSAKEKYAQLIKNATGVNLVRIIESNIAIFANIENKDSGTLLFDFGESTADFIYMHDCKKVIGFSWDLGASEIERSMARLAYMEMQQVQGFVLEPSSFVRLENDLRYVKECFYDGFYDCDGHDMICSFKTIDQKTKKHIITIDNDFMGKVVNGDEIHIKCGDHSSRTGTWFILCKEFFENAKDTLNARSLSINRIIITGGASKMGFVYDLCCEVFKGFPEAHILIDPDASVSIAKGLGLFAISEQNVSL